MRCFFIMSATLLVSFVVGSRTVRAAITTGTYVSPPIGAERLVQFKTFSVGEQNLPENSDITFKFAGSNDNYASWSELKFTDTSLDLTKIPQLIGSRYLKVEITLTQGGTTSPTLGGVTITYDTLEEVTAAPVATATSTGTRTTSAPTAVTLQTSAGTASATPAATPLASASPSSSDSVSTSPAAPTSISPSTATQISPAKTVSFADAQAAAIAARREPKPNFYFWFLVGLATLLSGLTTWWFVFRPRRANASLELPPAPLNLSS